MFNFALVAICASVLTIHEENFSDFFFVSLPECGEAFVRSSAASSCASTGKSSSSVSDLPAALLQCDTCSVLALTPASLAFRSATFSDCVLIFTLTNVSMLDMCFSTDFHSGKKFHWLVVSDEIISQRRLTWSQITCQEDPR